MIQRYTPMESSWSPLGEVSELQRAMSRLLGQADSFAEAFPPLNVFAGEEEAVIMVELPGFEKDHLEISANGSSVTLTGDREPADPGQKARYVRSERFQGRFKRTVELPFNVESDQVKASLRNGILEIHLPRAERDKPRKIQIQA